MTSTNAIQFAVATQNSKFESLGLQCIKVNAEQVQAYTRNFGAASNDNPVLVLLHGYPSSSYLWRHLIPLLPASAPLFVADLPGYGLSAPIEKNDKLAVGNVLMAALKTNWKRMSSTPDDVIPVLLIGHDRGARVAHRLAVSGVDGINIQGVCLMDIVPTTIQWSSFSASSAATSSFHWPLLANVPLATRLITSYGGDNWARDMIARWSGSNAQGLASMHADGALDVYAAFFTQAHTVDASCRDYEAGATVDVRAQEEDQGRGKRVRCPAAVVWSEAYLGQRFDVPSTWREWVEGKEVLTLGIGDGVGHFLPEEAPQECWAVVKRLLAVLGRRGGGDDTQA